MRMLRYIQESIDGLDSLKGRSSDVRQMHHSIKIGAPVQDVDPDGWLIVIKHGRESPSGMNGPLPILLVGHSDIGPSDFAGMLRDLRSSQEKQITPPAGSTSSREGRGIDVRELLFYGSLHTPFKAMMPASAESLKQVVARLDDLVSHPMVSQFINSVKDAGVVSVRELKPYLDRLSMEIMEPSSRPRTRGDLLAYSSYRFHNSYFRT